MSNLNVGNLIAGQGVSLPSYTTANLPSGKPAGTLAYDSTELAVKLYNGTSWVKVGYGATASGGTITTAGSYTIHTFTSTQNFVSPTSLVVDVLLVGGGGGGGSRNAGRDSGGTDGGAGGGAGGLVEVRNYVVPAGTHQVSVGGGGAGQMTPNNQAPGTNGVPSTFLDLVAYGGGYGGCGPAIAQGNGGPGGSGGGKGGGGGTGGPGGSATQPGAPGLSGAYGRGFPGGGIDASPPYTGGAGGGAGGAPPQSGGSGRVTPGGNGWPSTISGGDILYAGGGGGGGSNPGTVGGNGGPGGGGRGGSAPGLPSGDGEPGQTNRGGGGGGGAGSPWPAGGGGTGGPGIVIIRYLTP